MVEINHTYDTLSASALEESKYRLLYSKSKVYVYPTNYARDNIPGFVALVKRVCPDSAPRIHLDCSPVLQEAVNPTYLLSWIPERLLNERGTEEWDKFVKTEERMCLEDEDEGLQAGSFFLVAPLTPSSDAVLIDLPTSRAESYAFSVPLTSICSLSVYPPTLSSWCRSIYAKYSIANTVH